MVDIAHSVGVTVEAELGYITKVGINERSMKENLADPDIAKDFVETTGIDILAPAIGSIHGMGSQKATLDLDTLQEIRNKTDCYLSLHGGSGVDDSILRKAIDIGINKVSVYTRLSSRAVGKIRSVLSNDTELSQLMVAARDGFREMVEDRLRVLRSKNICNFETNVCTVCSSKYCTLPSEIENNNTILNDRDYRELIESITNGIITQINKA